MAWDGLLSAILVAAGFILAYHHLGYPVLLSSLAARRRSRAPAPQARTSLVIDIEAWPSITLIVPAHNEEKYIQQKIENMLGLQYPPGRLAMLLALDGCTDETRQLAERALAKAPTGADIRIVEFSDNVGKVAVLNQCISNSQTELVALSDTSAVVPGDALVRAADHFRQPGVGVVCGTYQLRKPSNEGERAYWHYQTGIKADEAILAAPMGAHGAFYLFRRSAWTPLEPDTINDDFILPMRIVATGYRAVYDQSIVALELEQTAVPQEFRRRARIGAGNLQQVVRLPELIDPRRGWLMFVFASGKGLRPFIPFVALLGVTALVLLALREHTWAKWLLFVISVATIGPLLWPRRALSRLPAPVAWLRYFIEGHAASLIGAVQYMAGLRSAKKPAPSSCSSRIKG